MAQGEFSFDQQRMNGLLVFRLAGPLTAEALPRFAPVVDAIDTSSLTQIRFEMQGVSRVDSRGLGALVGWHRHFLVRGIELRLVGVVDTVMRIFRVCNLTSLLNFGAEALTAEEQLLSRRQALVDSYEYSRNILIAMGQGLIGLDPEDGILFVNPEAEQLLGISEPEYQGRKFGEAFGFRGLNPVHSPPQTDGFVRAAMDSGGVFKNECRIGLSGENGTIPIALTVVAISRHDENVGAVVGLQDIRVQTEAAQALIESEARYRLLADNVSDVIWTTDLNLKVLYISPSIERLRGFSADEVMKRSPIDALTPESAAIAVQTMRDELLRESDGSLDPNRSVYMDLQMTRAEGPPVWVEVRASLLRDASGKAVGIVGVTRDIEQRKQIEAERESLQEQLLQTQKMEAIGTLAGGLAHDFNNLLTGILGHASMIRERPDLDPEITESLAVIEKAAERGAQLTNSLLGFARRTKVINVEFAVDDAIRDLTRLLSQTLDRRIEILYPQAPAGLRIVGDPAQFHHALLNLALNARDAMPEGGRLTFGVELVGAGKAQSAPASADPNAAYVMISVTDTGEGISPETKGRIFEPFFTTRGPGHGSGMGLAIVYGIVEGSGGWIEVDSAPGEGSTFRLFFPTAKPSEAKRTESRLAQGTGRILVVDDEEMLRSLAGKMLKRMGYTVTVAVDGVHALEVFGSDPDGFDLVLLDMMMPRMGGAECLKELRRIRSDVRVVLSSGYSRDETLREVMEENPSGFAQKPYRLQELSATVAEALASPA